MPVAVLKICKEHCPSARLIGKRYDGAPDWGEWWANDWFAKLEKQPALPFNGDAYIGAVRVVIGRPEHWIGMLFPENAEVPTGFDAVDIPALNYAVCYLQDKEGSSAFYTMETHEQCLEAIKAHGFVRNEDNWCMERYQCPRFTTPDEHGRVILDYAISIL